MFRRPKSWVQLFKKHCTRSISVSEPGLEAQKVENIALYNYALVLITVKLKFSTFSKERRITKEFASSSAEKR